MTSLQKFGVVSTTAAGGAAGSAALAHYLSSDGKVKNIADKFRKEYFTLISTKEDWETMLTKYNSTREASAQGSRFTNQNITWEELKSICEQAAKEDISEEKNASWKFRKWCVVPKSIHSHVLSYGLTPLKSGTSDTQDKASFVKLQKSYKDQGLNSIYNLKDNLNKQGTNQEDGALLKAECERMSKIESTDTSFDYEFKDYKSWCTQEAANQLPN
ncbi:hypothetical protein HF1_04260 [Mycoplasma haemofelis str. Langford 1]|uniref:Uncharacterized protein n=1 Tax=Mycoplasma haemofelis (strain Langford 1) TaxID=941640 RepID=E8ZH13_MYCHL|nr:hypothetical protein [Mycoplasma haemofelis]CBY92434.1 hypothetical protein HF1_04260 [Mycoplasma haemofelis str. Langford 1]